LRDEYNKNYELDKNFLALKQFKEQASSAEEGKEEDKVLSKFKEMTYMSFLNKQ